MERWAPPSAVRERPRRRPGQPSFSSTLLDAICDSLDEQAGGLQEATAERDTAAAPPPGGSAKKQQQAALHYYYYYKPSLAASHRAARAAADDCPSGRGYFSSSEVEYSLHRLRPIRTSGGVGPASVAPAEKQQPAPPGTAAARRARKPSSAAPASGGCRRPASPGARLASLLNAIFSGKRHSARQHPAPADDEPACSTAAPSSARPCLAKTPPSARARARSRSSRTVRFLDIEGEVAVAAAAAGCRRFPVVEVEDSDGGEESSDASSDLFELENLAALAPANGGSRCRRTCEDELPVYGTTGAGPLGHDIGHHRIVRRRPFGYVSHHGRSCRGLLDFK